MGENRPITSRIGKAFVLETATVKKKIKRDTAVIGLTFQRGLLDNLKKNISSRTHAIEKNGTRRKQVQTTHKRKPSCEGGRGWGGVRGRMWSARKSMMAELQPLVFA